MTSYYIGYQIPYHFSNSAEYILVGTAGDFVYINDEGALASAGEYINVRDGYLTIGGALRIVELAENPDTPIDGYGYLYADSNGILHFKNDDGVDISLSGDGYMDAHVLDTDNPHETSISNIGSGTLAELNSALSDATLDDSGDPRDPNSHADTHILDGSDELDGYNIAIDYTPTNYTTPVNGIIGEHIAAIDAALSNPVTDLTIADEEQGSILYFNGTGWVQLPPGEDGYALVTHSTGANPAWSSVAAAAAPVDSVFGRTGAITAATDDYSASQIGNDSAVTGEQVSDALEYLDGYVASVADDVAGISTMAVSGDLSGNLPNPTVTDLTIASEEEGSVLYFDGTNWVQLPPGTDGYVLTTHGNNPPTWEVAGSSGDAWSAFTITTVTKNVEVWYALPIQLPATPTDGDTVWGRLRIRGFGEQGVIKDFLTTSIGSYEAEVVYEFIYTTMGGWELQYASSDLLAINGGTGVGALEAYCDTPTTRETIPVRGTTFNDDDGLCIFYAEWSPQGQHTFPA